MPKKSREFFYRDKDGEPQDKDLHEPILSGISPEAEARVREIGKKYARKAGLTEEEIMMAYADPTNAPEEGHAHFTEQELNVIQERVEADLAKNGQPSDEDLMKEIKKMNDAAPKFDDR